MLKQPEASVSVSQSVSQSFLLVSQADLPSRAKRGYSTSTVSTKTKYSGSNSGIRASDSAAASTSSVASETASQDDEENLFWIKMFRSKEYYIALKNATKLTDTAAKARNSKPSLRPFRRSH